MRGFTENTSTHRRGTAERCIDRLLFVTRKKRLRLDAPLHQHVF